METLSPEQSLLLIQQTIADAKGRFKENGVIFMMWGILIAGCSFAHYVFDALGYAQAHLSYSVLSLGFVVTFIYYFKKSKSGSHSWNLITKILAYLGWFTGLNIVILSIVFATMLKALLIPMIAILLSMNIIIVGVALREKAFLWGGIVANIIAIFTFFVPYLFQPLMQALIAIVAFIVPSILLYQKQKYHV